MISDEQLDDIQKRLETPPLTTFGPVEVNDMLNEIRALRKVVKLLQFCRHSAKAVNASSYLLPLEAMEYVLAEYEGKGTDK